MTRISKYSNKWYVVKSMVSLGCIIWMCISEGYDTSEQATARLFDMVYGKGGVR